MKFYKKIDYFIITGILIGILAFGVLYGYSTEHLCFFLYVFVVSARESNVNVLNFKQLLKMYLELVQDLG